MTAFDPLRSLGAVFGGHPSTLASHFDAMTMYLASYGFAAKIEALGNDKGR